MGKIFTEPKYPVIEKAPGFWRTVGNYNLTDWSLVGVLGAIGYPVGYIAAGNQSPPFARLGGNLGRSSAMMAAFLGGSAGFLLAYQNSWGRLTGFNPNEAEVRGMKQ